MEKSEERGKETEKDRRGEAQLEESAEKGEGIKQDK